MQNSSGLRISSGVNLNILLKEGSNTYCLGVEFMLSDDLTVYLTLAQRKSEYANKKTMNMQTKAF